MADTILAPTKACPKCGVERELTEYRATRRICKFCLALESTRYYVQHPEKKKLHCKTYRTKQYGTRPYNLDGLLFDRMLAEQGGVCAICGIDKPRAHFKKFHIDHCHETGAIRGLLCNLCNAGLGMFKDNPERIQKALEYLKRPARSA